MNTLLPDSQVSLIHARGLRDHSVSNHLAPTVIAFSCYPSARPLPVSRFRFHPRYAGSSGIPGRIEFLNVRTGRSPPAAPHPASWRRSCIRLQAGEHMPEEDLHLSDLTRSQAHIPPALCRVVLQFLPKEKTNESLRIPPPLRRVVIQFLPFTGG